MDWATQEGHREAVALLEEVAGLLGLDHGFLRDLVFRVTGRPWEEVDPQGAEAVIHLLAEALYRTLQAQKR